MALDTRTWDALEVAARNAAAAGGFAAMGYYRDALRAATVLDGSVNPSTEADVQATLAILRTLDPMIGNATGGGLGRSYFAEELASAGSTATTGSDRISAALEELGGVRKHVCLSGREFAKTFSHGLAVLIDGLDGTTSFRAGIPLFCSAVAMFVDGEPRIGAIYDPIHNVVYSGSVRSEHEGSHNASAAYVWNVQSGTRSSLPLVPELAVERGLLGIHITRSNAERQAEALGLLGRLLPAMRGTYMLNSGQLALAYVASGNLSAFVNNHTNLWDIAAGEVLVRAVGGRVTNLDGSSIRYDPGESDGGESVSVLASINPEVHDSLLGLIRGVPPSRVI